MTYNNTSEATTKFSLNLYRTILPENSTDNAFISPFSLFSALSMTQLGAAGKTAEGMVEALCWEKGQDSIIHQENQGFLAKLLSLKRQTLVSVANRLFVEKDYSLKTEFLEQTKSLYSAEAESALFKSRSEEERVRINDWVSVQTKEKIKDLLPPGVVDSDTRMVLVNAIHFKGKWEYKFHPGFTKPIEFKMSPGNSKPVPTMFLENFFSFWLDDGTEGFSVLEMPYEDSDLSMVLFLPTEDFGLEKMERSLTLEKIKSAFSKLKQNKIIKLYLPKFEMTCSYMMKCPLIDLGMADLFDRERADLGNMITGNDLCVSEVVHKAFVRVDEDGSEAAASTADIMMFESEMPDMDPLPEFSVDHPFFFVIRDKKASDYILFMGRVANPLSTK